MDPVILLFLIPILLVVGFMLYQVKTKGFIGTAFGAKILTSSDAIKLSQERGINGHIKIHTLEINGKMNIGIEVVQKTPLSYDMTALSFQREDIVELVSTLTVALENTESNVSGMHRDKIER